MKIYNYTK